MFAIDQLMTTLMTYGAPLLGVFLMLGAMGFPIPGTLLVVASGAFVRQGLLSPQAALVGLCGAVIGDSLSYTMGRRSQGWLLRRFGATSAWQRANKAFQNNGGAAVYLTRWLFTGIAIPTNLVAGGSGYRFERFLLYDLVGETTWIIIFGGLGYWFGSQWEALSQYLSQFSAGTMAAAALLLAAYLATRLAGKYQLFAGLKPKALLVRRKY